MLASKKYQKNRKAGIEVTLADLKSAHTGKYELINAKLIRAGNPIMTWQNLTITDGSGDYEMSTRYDVNLPDMEIGQDMVGKMYQFRIKAIKNGPFTNLRGHIAGPAKE